MKSSKVRSVGAIALGLVVTIVLTTIVDIVLHITGVYPPMGVPMDNRLAMIALSYRIVISIGGAWLTARAAPEEPMKHALILGLVGTLLGTLGAVMTWDKGLGPAWYAVSLAVLALPQCWVGGKLYEARLRKITA